MPFIGGLHLGRLVELWLVLGLPDLLLEEHITGDVTAHILLCYGHGVILQRRFSVR